MIPTIDKYSVDFDTFTVIAKANGLFLKESSWPVHVQFAKEFFLNCDDRFVRFFVEPYFHIEIKLENAKATYKLSDDPFRKDTSLDVLDFLNFYDLIEGVLVEGKVLFNNE